MLPHPPMARRAMAMPQPRRDGPCPANPWARSRPAEPAEGTAAPALAVLPLLGGTALALGLAGMLAGALVLG